MNITAAEMLKLGLTGQPNSVSLQVAALQSLWTVVTLQRTGDSANDPYRTINCFASRASALTFAQAQKFTDTQDAVLIFNSTGLDTLVSGSQVLSDMFCGKAMVSHPAPSLNEMSTLCGEAVKLKPNTLVKPPDHWRNYK